MAKANVVLTYREEGIDKTSVKKCDYFLDSKSVHEYSALGYLDGRRTGIEIIINRFNFEVNPEKVNLRAEVNNRKFKIMNVMPAQGFGLAVTQLFGSEQD